MMYQLSWIALVTFIYILVLSPALYFLVIHPKLKKKIGVKIESTLEIAYPMFIKNYLYIPLEVSMYIGTKYLLERLGFNSDKIKVGKGILQRVSYSTKEFSFLEILFSIFNLLVWFFWAFGGIALLYFKKPEYFALY